jgi:hypothetical protein
MTMQLYKHLYIVTEGAKAITATHIVVMTFALKHLFHKHLFNNLYSRHLLQLCRNLNIFIVKELRCCKFYACKIVKLKDFTDFFPKIYNLQF